MENDKFKCAVNYRCFWKLLTVFNIYTISFINQIARNSKSKMGKNVILAIFKFANVQDSSKFWFDNFERNCLYLGYCTTKDILKRRTLLLLLQYLKRSCQNYLPVCLLMIFHDANLKQGLNAHVTHFVILNFAAEIKNGKMLNLLTYACMYISKKNLECKYLCHRNGFFNSWFHLKKINFIKVVAKKIRNFHTVVARKICPFD